MNRRLENENRRTAQVQSEYKATIKKANPQVESSSKDGNSKAVNIIIVALTAVAVILFALLVRSIIKNNGKKQVPQESKTEAVSVLELDLSLDGEFVKGLYDKIPVGLTGVEPYYAIKTQQTDLTENNKASFVLNKIDNGISEGESIEYSKVDEEYKKTYGNTSDAPKITVECYAWCKYDYDEATDSYIKHLENGLSRLVAFQYKREIEKVEKNDNNTEVYIYDTFICFDTTGDINSFGVFATSDKNVAIETGLTRGHDSGRREDIYGGKTVNELFDDYKEKRGKFKHTFKLDEAGNYYWYSSEYLKE